MSGKEKGGNGYPPYLMEKIAFGLKRALLLRSHDMLAMLCRKECALMANFIA